MKTNNKTPRPNHGVKSLGLFATMAIVACIITGCVVTSVYPYFKTKDVAFDDALLGKWIPADQTNATAADEFWSFEKISDRAYKLSTIDGGQINHYDAVLFKLGGGMFLDCLPQERHELHTPSHVLLRVSSIQPQLKMELMSLEWLSGLVEKNPNAIRHLIVTNSINSDRGDLVLTADTSELQKFVLKHLKTDDAWLKPMLMKRPDSQPSPSSPPR